MAGQLVAHAGSLIAKRREKLAVNLNGSGIDVDRFIATAGMSLMTNSDLRGKIEDGVVDQDSLLIAVSRCAADHLMLDGNEAALATFKIGQTKRFSVAYMPMYKGLIKRLLSSGVVSNVYAKVVYDKEVFDLWNDEHGQHFRHVPRLSDKGKPVAVYAVAVMTAGGSQYEVLDAEEIKAISSTSRKPQEYVPGKGTFWTEWWRKAAVRRLAKYLPLRNDQITESVLNADNQMFDLDPEEEVHQKPARAPKKAKSRAKAVTEVAPPDITDAEIVEPEGPPAVESTAGGDSGATDEPPI